jgi:hypothetical protein
VGEDGKFEFEEGKQRKVKTDRYNDMHYCIHVSKGDHSHSSIIIYRKCI